MFSWCHSAGGSSQLHAKCTQSRALLWQIWLPKGVIPQSVHTAQPRNCFLLRGALRVARKICSQELLCREGKCPFLCVPGPQQEFLCCWWQGIPCCVLNQQEIVPLSSLPPWPCSPATASPQSWGGEGRGGEGRGHCPNAFSYVITPTPCPTQLLITTRVKLSSIVSE